MEAKYNALIHNITFDLLIRHFIDVSGANREQETLHSHFIPPGVVNTNIVKLL